MRDGAEPLLKWTDVEIDNLRAAFAWSREIGDNATALRLVSSLHPYWLERGRFREGLAGFGAVLTDQRPPTSSRRYGCARSPTTAPWPGGWACRRAGSGHSKPWP